MIFKMAMRDEEGPAAACADQQYHRTSAVYTYNMYNTAANIIIRSLAGRTRVRARTDIIQHGSVSAS